MAVVIVFCTEQIRDATITDVQATAAYLQILGETAKPCPRTGCKRPDGHPGRHYYTEDDSRAVSLYAYR